MISSALVSSSAASFNVVRVLRGGVGVRGASTAAASSELNAAVRAVVRAGFLGAPSDPGGVGEGERSGGTGVRIGGGGVDPVPRADGIDVVDVPRGRASQR